MEFTSEKFSEVFENFRLGRRSLNDYSVEIVGGENSVPPILLLRTYEAEDSLDNSMRLAEAFCADKEIVFRKNGVEVHRVSCKGGDLNRAFEDCPYYLDLLLKVCYGLMIKKLTPPSPSSETVAQQ